MAVTNGFFNSIAGDRKYNAEQIGNYFEGLIGNGVFENVGNKLAVVVNGNLDIVVKTGRAMVNCHWLKNDTDLTLTLDSADIQYARIDAVVVKLDLNNNARTVSIEIKKGTPSISPTAPVLDRTNTVYELCLATIKIPANATSITQANITDKRGNSDLCGYVTGLIKQVDTSDLFLQYQTALEEYYQTATAEINAIIAQKTTDFDNWFDDLTSELRVDTTLRKYSIQRVLGSHINAGTPIVITDENFNSDDLLLIHINGILLNENEFSVSGSNITFTNDLDEGNSITIIGIKSVIGSNSGNVPASVTIQGTLAANSVAGNIEIIEEES